MSRAYLDTNFLFGLFRQEEGARRDPTFRGWRERVEVEMSTDRPIISALVIDELSYRMILAWIGDGGGKDPLGTYRADTPAVMRRMRSRLRGLWKSIAQLEPELAPSEDEDVVLAQNLMIDPGLAPRNAFHAAYAIRGGCRWMISSHAAFDRLDRIERLGP